MTADKNPYVTTNIPREQHDTIKMIIKDKRTGYSSVMDFIRKAIHEQITKEMSYIEQLNRITEENL